MTDFLTICQLNEDKIVLITSGHTHFADLRFELSEDYFGNEYSSFGMFVTPGISPIYSNNPGYTVLDICDGEIVDGWFTFLDLSSTIVGEIDDAEFNFFQVNLFDDVCLEEISADGFWQFTQDLLIDEEMYIAWRAYKSGFLPGEPNGDAILASIGLLDSTNVNPYSPFICQMSNMLYDDYLECVSNSD